MVILGITGGSGCGKTLISDAFSRLGADVADGDRIAREITAPGSPALAEIKEYFGQEYLTEDGTLDRKKLGAYVFSNPAALETLNRITHRYIAMEIDRRIAKSRASVFCIDAAALLESSIRYDKLLVVLADEDVRIRRICRRDALTSEAAKQRIHAQRPDAFYIQRADFVVYNNGDADTMEQEAKKIMEKLENEN